MPQLDEKSLQKSQMYYVIEAALEYLVALTVSGSFLATLTKQLGMSDALTGIISSVISLGCLFQMFSLTILLKRSKPFVVAMSVINQLLFMLLYLIPLTGLEQQPKIVLFVVTILLAYFTYNIASPRKTDWLMSLVDNRQRGRFTANKEIVSLITGMTYSFALSAVVDRLVEGGNYRTAFIVAAAVLLSLTVLHTLTMVLTVEKPARVGPDRNLKESLSKVLRNKNVYRVMLVSVLYYVASYVSTPFYSVYMISELGFSLTFVSVLGIVTSVSRILVSRFWGSYADRKSFAALLEKCFMLFTLSFVFAMMARPENGKVMFILYNICYGIAMGGINSGVINLVFDYAPAEQRADALAICQACAGLVGFLTTLAASPLVTAIQNAGNTFMGITVYAQQVVSAVSVLFGLIAVMYVRMMFIRNENKHN